MGMGMDGDGDLRWWSILRSLTFWDWTWRGRIRWSDWDVWVEKKTPNRRATDLPGDNSRPASTRNWEHLSSLIQEIGGVESVGNATCPELNVLTRCHWLHFRHPSQDFFSSGKASECPAWTPHRFACLCGLYGSTKTKHN